MTSCRQFAQAVSGVKVFERIESVSSAFRAMLPARDPRTPQFDARALAAQARARASNSSTSRELRVMDAARSNSA